MSHCSPVTNFYNLSGRFASYKTVEALLHFSHPTLILWFTPPSIFPSFCITSPIYFSNIFHANKTPKCSTPINGYIYLSCFIRKNHESKNIYSLSHLYHKYYDYYMNWTSRFNFLVKYILK